MIKVPNLTDVNALEFSGMIQNYQLSEGEIFDFSGITEVWKQYPVCSQ